MPTSLMIITAVSGLVFGTVRFAQEPPMPRSQNPSTAIVVQGITKGFEGVLEERDSKPVCVMYRRSVKRLTVSSDAIEIEHKGKPPLATVRREQIERIWTTPGTGRVTGSEVAAGILAGGPVGLTVALATPGDGPYLYVDYRTNDGRHGPVWAFECRGPAHGGFVDAVRTYLKLDVIFVSKEALEQMKKANKKAGSD